jgi:hypothetical protein
MKRTMHGVVLLAFAQLWACGPGASPREAAAAESPPPTLEGAWHVTQISHESGPDAGEHTVDVQPAIHIFAKTHYAVTGVTGFAARAYIGQDASLAEQGQAFAAFHGNAGTYTVSGDTLTLLHQVDIDPANMAAGKTTTYDLSWSDGKAVLSTTTPDRGLVQTELTRLQDDALTVSAEAARLRGVWRRAEMVIDSGEDMGAHVDDMQPGFYIFAPPYFAGNYVTSFAPRPELGERPADAEVGRVYGAFASFAGTYKVEDNVLVFRPLVAKNPSNMRGRPFQSIKTEWAGDDVWLIYTREDGRENRVRLTRIED